MGLLDSIKEAIGGQKQEEIDVELKDAGELFRERKAYEIEEAREEASEIIEKTQGLVDELEDALEELKGYEDKKGIQAVEDVAENFYRSRKEIVREFEASEDVEEHFQRLDDMLQEFNDVSLKEGAVMNRVHKSSGVLSERIEAVMEHRDELEEFIQKDYAAVTQLEEVENALKEIRNLEEEIEELEQEIEDLESNDIQQEIDNRQEELEELKQRPEWNRKQEILDSIEELEHEKSELESKHSRNASVVERGLKKLLYNIRNQGLSFQGDTVVLEAIRDEKFGEVRDPAENLEEALEAIKKEDILGERQLSKFSGAVEAFEDFEHERERIQQINSEIKELEKELDGLDITDEKKGVENRIEGLKHEKDEQKDKLEMIERNLGEAEKDLEASIDNLEEYLDDALNADVSINSRD